MLPPQPSQPFLNEALVPERSRLLRWWYGLTTPVEATPASSVFERERGRKALLISGMTGALLLILGVLFPISFFIPNKYVLLLVGGLFLLCCLALLLNRRGKTNFAGSIVVLLLEVALLLIISTTRPFGTLNTRLFDFLILPTIFATAFFSGAPAFWLTGANSLFVFCIVSFQLLTPEFKTVLVTQYYNVLALPICLMWVAAFLFYRAFHGEKQATIRADRAEVIVQLEQERAEEARLLEKEIEAIIQTHVQVANGNIQARVDLNKQTKLYGLAHSLNQLLLRSQRSAEAAHELYSLQKRFPAMVNFLQETTEKGLPIPSLPATGSFIDPLFSWLRGKRLITDSSNHTQEPSSIPQPEKKLPRLF